jgi:hypothetical protein
MAKHPPWTVRVWTKKLGIIFEQPVPYHYLSDADVKALGRALILKHRNYDSEDIISAYCNRRRPSSYSKQVTQPERFTDLEKADQGYVFGDADIFVFISQKMSAQWVNAARTVRAQNLGRS